MKPAFTAVAYALAFPTFNATRNRWEMPDSRCERMQCLFETEAEALEFKRQSLANLASREKWEADNAAAQAKAIADRAAYLASFRGFLPIDPMKAGRLVQTLEVLRNWRGDVMTRKELVERMVMEGRTLTADGLCPAGDTNTFMSITKTEAAYAAHLIALRDSAGST